MLHEVTSGCLQAVAALGSMSVFTMPEDVENGLSQKRRRISDFS